jgi:hypothetical protein
MSGDVVGGPIGPGEGGEAVIGDPDTPPDGEVERRVGHEQHITGGLMLTFGAAHPGREQLAVEVFRSLSRFLGEVLADHLICSFKPYFYAAGGVGTTAAFFLVEGDRDQLEALRRRDDFQRLLLRAGTATADVRVHALVAGAAAGRLANLYRDVFGELDAR